MHLSITHNYDDFGEVLGRYTLKYMSLLVHLNYMLPNSYPLLLTRWMYFMSWIVLHNHVATHFNLILAGFVDFETCCHIYCFFTDIASSHILLLHRYCLFADIASSHMLPLRRYCLFADIDSSHILLLQRYCLFADIASSQILLLHRYCFFTDIASSHILLLHRYCFLTDIASSQILLPRRYCFFTYIASSQISLQQFILSVYTNTYIINVATLEHTCNFENIFLFINWFVTYFLYFCQ